MMPGEPQNTGWFELNRPQVEGFEFGDCPHGIIRRNSNEETYPFEYMCERCGELLHASQPA